MTFQLESLIIIVLSVELQILEILAPSHCPSCSSELVWEGDLLYCRSLDCGEVKQAKVIHFAKTLKIKGLGPAAIAKLNLTNIIDIYDLSLSDITVGLSSTKLASKLYEEIEDSKKAALQKVLPGFSIPLIGRSATDKLCEVLTHLSELSVEICTQAGLGPKATSNLMDWFVNEYPLLANLPFSFSATVTDTASTSSMGIVCITGKLVSVKTKSEAEKLLVAQGYSIKSSLTKDVTILVNESGIESAKTKKARDAGVSIITNLNELLGV